MENTFIGIDIEQFKEVKNQAEFDELETLMAGFHDSLIKEVHILNPGYVDQESIMYLSTFYNLRLLIQSQWNESPAIEVILGEVYEIHLFDLSEIYSGHGKITYEIDRYLLFS